MIPLCHDLALSVASVTTEVHAYHIREPERHWQGTVTSTDYPQAATEGLC
jgi:hypothetical protein